MQCPFCEHKDSKVIDSRHTDTSSIRRRRECEKCKKRFTTYERIELHPVLVIKKDNRREEFNREKIKYGIVKSCEKRPVSLKQIEEMVDEIEAQVNKKYTDEIDSYVIGNLIMDKLKEVDEVAYVRFASVYRQFKDASSFIDELNAIISNKNEEAKDKHLNDEAIKDKDGNDKE